LDRPWRAGLDVKGREGAMSRGWAAALIAVTIAATSFAAGFLATFIREPTARADTGLTLIWETWGYAERYFYGEMPDDADLVHGAIDGALRSLEDPYTRLVRPVANSLEQDRLRGAHGGIGATVYETEGYLYLLALPDTPAGRAGIRDDDRLLAVDGVDLPAGADADLAKSWLRGEVGTSVTVTVLRPSSRETLEFTVERAEIAEPSVEFRLLEGVSPPTGYVRVAVFGERTPAELQRALATVRAQEAEQVVLDLRGNPGGLLDTAVEVASRFLRRGVVAYEVDADEVEKRYGVRPRVVATEPLVVLVDEATASAAEIVAGALQDQGRALLVGRPTRGKGSVQLAYQLSDGSSLHVTTSLWLTPDKNQINQVGLQPDVIVEADAGEGDVVLDAGLRALADGRSRKEAGQ